MDEYGWLARQFDENRSHLRAVAYRMLGSAAEAEDAVQEAWLKLSRIEGSQVENLGGWLTTVIARICLDMLRLRRARREEPLATEADVPHARTPEEAVAFADAIGPALLVVLQTLAPAERVAFVLHDMFDLSFEEIAPILDRSPAAARQLASRARRRVRGVQPTMADLERSGQVVNAFLAASRDGDFAGLLALLSPDVVLYADTLAVQTATARAGGGAPLIAPEVHGPSLVADAFKGRARAASRALIDGHPGAVWAVDGEVRAAFLFTIEDEAITRIELVMAPDHLAELDVSLQS